MHSLGLFISRDSSLAPWQFLVYSFNRDLGIGRRGHRSTSSLWQSPVFLVGFGQSREYMDHNRGMEEEETEDIWGSNYGAALYPYLSLKSIITLPTNKLPSPRFKSRFPFSIVIILTLSEVHLFYGKLSKSMQKCSSCFYKWNGASVFGYQGYLVEEKNSQINPES